MEHALLGPTGSAAKAGAASDGAALRAEQAAATLNPVRGFAERADALYAHALTVYAQHAADRGGGSGDGSSSKGCCDGNGEGGGALHAVAAAKALQLRRDVVALLLRLTRRQLAALRADAFATFRADLAITFADSKVYGKAARRPRGRQEAAPSPATVPHGYY